MDDFNDPRVYFAAERTLLAWIRTGLTVIGFGFVVARFGLFLRLMRGDVAGGDLRGSTLIGVGLVLLGSGALALAAWQHVRFCRDLGATERPRSVSRNWSVWYAAALSVVGIVLAGYILLHSGTK